MNRLICIQDKKTLYWLTYSLTCPWAQRVINVFNEFLEYDETGCLDSELL